MAVMNLTVDTSDMRLDKYLAEEIEILSRTKIKECIKKEGVLVDGHSVKPSYLLRGGEIIRIDIPEERPSSLDGENIPLHILHEDDDVIVLNKPAELVIHPGAGNRSGTLVNGLIYHFDQLSGLSGRQRPGIVHRLDKDTSGALVVAKTDRSHMHLAQQFTNKTIEKTYLALVWGIPENDDGIVNAPIVRHHKNRQKFVIGDSGKEAVTEYRLLKEFGHLSLFELVPKTGRTHQIRVHLSSINHPVFADNVYGGGVSRAKGFLIKQRRFFLSLFKLIQRQALHALSISLDHPGTGERVTYVAPIPQDFQAVLHQLESQIE